MALQCNLDIAQTRIVELEEKLKLLCILRDEDITRTMREVHGELEGLYLARLRNAHQTPCHQRGGGAWQVASTSPMFPPSDQRTDFLCRLIVVLLLRILVFRSGYEKIMLLLINMFHFCLLLISMS